MVYGFNPCYDGFVFLTSKPLLEAKRTQQVSILVMMDLSFWQHNSKQILKNKTVVSILVMMDLSFWPWQDRLSLLPWRFQSLLWWICLFDKQIRAAQVEVRGFNPCYDGFVFLTSVCTTSVICWFVSILVMMDLSFWHLQNPMSESSHVKFQSLLWWICLFDTT